MDGLELTRLKVGDEGFLVSSLIERCPRVMMLRELVRNALEAAATAPSGERAVEIDAVLMDGTPKLRIRNSGRGMDAAELFRMADLAASIRKPHGLDRNFGMGAKVASLPSNRLGLRYRSCHAGVVRETLLGWRDGAYGRIRQQAPDGSRHEVLTLIDTGDARLPDWTEVVLFGNAAGQDTSLDPYAGDPPMPPDWLHEELSARFFRIDDAVRLLVRGTSFEPLSQRLPRLAVRCEVVTLPDGVRLHYAWSPPGSEPSLSAMAGLVHRGELYDMQRGQDWLYMAPVFGIPFAASGVILLAELPDDHPVVPDGYRQFLRYAGGRQDEMSVRDLAPVLQEHRPAWLRAIIEAEAPNATIAESVYRSLQHLLRTLGVTRRSRLVTNGRGQRRSSGQAEPSFDNAAEPSSDNAAEASADDAAEPVSDDGAVTTVDDQAAPLGTVPDDDGVELEPVPEILLLRSPDDIAARGLIGRAGRYYPESHQLFLNGTYDALVEMRETLERAFAGHAEPDGVRDLAYRAAEQAMAERVGRMLVFALSKQGQWPEGDLSQALSPHALSLAADDWRQGLAEARRTIDRALDAAAL